MTELIKSIQERDPAKPGFLEVLLSYPGYHAVCWHSISHYLWRYKLKTLSRFLAHIGRLLTGIEIHPGAKLGKSLFIDHGMGVVIGETAEIGDDVTIYHGVTLGGVGGGKGAKRHPTLESGVMVGAGAQILGDIVIGSGARVGANAVVTKDIPPKCTAVGNPARIINCKDHKASYGLPQSEFIDPLVQTLDGLVKDVEALKQFTRYDDQVPDKKGIKQDRYSDIWKGSGI